MNLYSIEKAISYENKDIPKRFTTLFEISLSEANNIFMELKKWLWICAEAYRERNEGKSKVPESMVIDTPTLILDEMWHNFICFTQQYEIFCNQFLGHFVHHFPSTDEKREKIAEELRSDPMIQVNRRKIQYNYILDKLGKETLVLWYHTYPLLFSKEIILRKRLK